MLQLSNYVGALGERIEFFATLKFAHKFKYFPEDERESIIYIFKDDDGNIFKWRTEERDLKRETRYRVRGTVEKHDYYQGTKQTVITRCLIKDIDGKRCGQALGSQDSKEPEEYLVRND